MIIIVVVVPIVVVIFVDRMSGQAQELRLGKFSFSLGNSLLQRLFVTSH